MKIYVILYQDLWLNSAKVSQQAYRTFEEARAFCLERVGAPVSTKNDYEYYSVTKEKYTIVEVTV